MDLANQSGASSIEGAVQKLNGLLSEPSKPTESKDNPAPEAKQEPINESNAQETPVEQSDTDKPSRRRKAKLGEREIEFEVLTDDVDLDLIPKGLMMENDYRQKTMSLADERKAFEANKSDYDKALAELNDIVMMNAKKLDSDEMKELKELNPDQYWKEFEEVKTKADKLKSFKEKRDKELLAEQQKAMDAEVNKYSQIIPEWLDESVKTKDVEI